jgi:hypothetical protein
LISAVRIIGNFKDAVFKLQTSLFFWKILKYEYKKPKQDEAIVLNTIWETSGKEMIVGVYGFMASILNTI